MCDKSELSEWRCWCVSITTPSPLCLSRYVAPITGRLGRPYLSLSLQTGIRLSNMTPDRAGGKRGEEWGGSHFLNAQLNDPPAATAMAPSLPFLFHFHHFQGIIKSRRLGGAGSGGWVGAGVLPSSLLHKEAFLPLSSNSGQVSVNVTSLCNVIWQKWIKCIQMIFNKYR